MEVLKLYISQEKESALISKADPISLRRVPSLAGTTLDSAREPVNLFTTFSYQKIEK